MPVRHPIRLALAVLAAAPAVSVAVSKVWAQQDVSTATATATAPMTPGDNNPEPRFEGDYVTQQSQLPEPYRSLGGDPRVRTSIAEHYARTGTELSGRCGGVVMSDVVEASTVTREGPDAVVSVTYRYATRDPGTTGMDCSGTNSRLFTLAPDGDGGWRVVTMSPNSAG